MAGAGKRQPQHQSAWFENSAHWHSVAIGADKGAFAIDRARAHSLAYNEILPRLESGKNVELDFTGIANTTQPFCHSLIVPILLHGGDEVLTRIRFIACSARTRSPIRFAVSHGIQAREGT